MYSWNTIRTVFAVLLIIPVLHLALLLSKEVAATLNTSPTAWADEVNAYTRAYQSIELPEKPVVVIGGRRVKLWSGLENLLSPRPVLMLGLGNATVDDLIYYHTELVGHFQPAAVVLFPGNSEFHIRDNKSAEQLVASIARLVDLDQSYGIPRRYYIFSPIKSPLYPGDFAKIDEANRLLADWALNRPQVSLLDANRLLALRNGSPNPDFFRMDGSNLNEQGYLRVSVMLQNLLEQDEAGP